MLCFIINDGLVPTDCMQSNCHPPSFLLPLRLLLDVDGGTASLQHGSEGLWFGDQSLEGILSAGMGNSRLSGWHNNGD